MSRLDLEPTPNVRAIDPAIAYEHPKALAADSGLSVSERLALLRRWDHDVREEIVARVEGMPGPEPRVGLGAIAAAMQALEREEPSTVQTPTQHGSVPSPEPSEPGGGEAGVAGGPHERADVPLAEIPLDRAPAGTRPRRASSRRVAALAALAGLAVGVTALSLLFDAPAGLAAGGAVLALAALYLFAPRPWRR